MYYIIYYTMLFLPVIQRYYLLFSAKQSTSSPQVSNSLLLLFFRDLLDLSGDDLEVRLGKQGTHVHNLSEWRVSTVDEALELFGRYGERYKQP